VALQPKLIDYPSAQFLLIGQNVRQVSFNIPVVKHESMETPDKQIEELVHWSDEMEKAQPGNYFLKSCGSMAIVCYWNSLIAPNQDMT
jgi:hypothetical protein